MEFRTSIPKTLWLLFAGVVMIVASWFAATHASDYRRFVGWFGVVFFSFAFVLVCRQLLRREPSLLMSAEGISGPRMGAISLRWPEITAVSVGQIRRQKFLCVWLQDQEAYLARLPAARRLVAQANIAMGFAPVSLSFGGLTPGLPEALDYARRYVLGKAEVHGAQPDSTLRR